MFFSFSLLSFKCSTSSVFLVSLVIHNYSNVAIWSWYYLMICSYCRYFKHPSLSFDFSISISFCKREMFYSYAKRSLMCSADSSSLASSWACKACSSSLCRWACSSIWSCKWMAFDLWTFMAYRRLCLSTTASSNLILSCSRVIILCLFSLFILQYLYI